MPLTRESLRQRMYSDRFRGTIGFSVIAAFRMWQQLILPDQLCYDGMHDQMYATAPE